MELKLERCTIRDWRMTDAESLAKHANNRRVWITLRDRFPHPYSIEDAKEFLSRTATGPSEKNFCIEIDGAAVGGIGFIPGEDVYRHTAEFGYWLGQEFWGHGIMSEVIPAFVDYCFGNFALNRISAQTYANNPASARRSGKSRLRPGGTFAQERRQRRTSSRFVSLRENDLAFQTLLMHYLVIEQFKDAPAIYQRLEEKGRMMPEGLKYISSWIDHHLKTCWQVMETDDFVLLERWMDNWKDLMDFKIVPVRTSAEVREMIKQL